MPQNEPITEYFQTILADRKLEIECKYRYVFNQFGKNYYAWFRQPDYVLRVTDEEIAQERAYAVKTDLDEGRKPQYHAPDKLESLAISRKLANTLLPEGILLFHAAAIAADGKCCLFMAKSGTGKTTHIRMWMQQHPDCIVVNGDKPLVDIEKRLVYGTPWCGKERYGSNTSAPLSALVWLQRGERNEMERISFSALLPCLLQQVHIPDGQTLQVMRLLSRLQDVPCYRLRCNMDSDAGELSYRTLIEGTE